MRITLCGAAGEVTGSGYLVETADARVLVDFGMFQGRSATPRKNRTLGPVKPKSLDAVVLTHAHLDHTGRLPLLVREGLTARIHCTPATVDFTKLILADSAKIQHYDASRQNRKRKRAGKPPLDALYEQDDVSALNDLFEPLRYETTREIATGVTIRLVDAGHILGSASIEMRIKEGSRERIVIFSGDIGPRDIPILRDPTPFTQADLVFMESTYGNRNHRPLEDTVEEFRSTVIDSVRAREKVLIPSFAIGRAQLVLYHIAELIRNEKLPEFPIYLDSPMAIAATELYEKHKRNFDEEAKELVASHQIEKDLRNLHYLESASESRAVNESTEGSIVIAGSGMCNGGRILHHFKHNLWREKVSVLIVGYMSYGSLGRRLIDGDPFVRVMGQKVAVRAKVHTLGGFSGHAGQVQLIDWFSHVAPSKPRLVLTHGESRARVALAAKIQEQFQIDAEQPEYHNVIEFV